MRPLLAFLAVPLLCAAPRAWAQDQAKHQFLWSVQAGGRVAPQGLQARGLAGYRLRLFNRDGQLFKDSHLALLASTVVTPTYAFAGARLRVEPLAVLRLWADYQVGGYFGTLNSVQSFETSLSELSPKEQHARMQEPVKQRAFAQRLTVAGRLQAKYRRFAVRHTAQARWFHLYLPKEDKAWFSINLDIIAPARGWTLFQDSDLLFEIKQGLFVAARFSQTHAFHQDRARPIVLRRLGPAVVWRRPGREGSRIKKRTWFAMLQWNLTHPYRNGKIQSVAMPMILLGWGIDGAQALGRNVVGSAPS